MPTVIGLHDGIGPYDLPGDLYEIAAHQAVCPHCHPQVPLVVAILVHARGQANISRQMLDVVKAPQVPQLADDAAGHDAANVRDTAQQIIVLLWCLRQYARSFDKTSRSSPSTNLKLHIPLSRVSRAVGWAKTMESIQPLKS